MMTIAVRFRKSVNLVSNLTDRVVAVATIVSAIAFTLLIFAAVVSRYFFHFSIIFSVEISKLLFVWSAFLAATVTYKRKAHIRFEFINMVVGPRGIVITDLLFYCSAIVFFLTLLTYSIQFTRIVWPTYLPVLGLSQGWLYVAVIASCVIFLIHSLDLLLSTIQTARDTFASGRNGTSL